MWIPFLLGRPGTEYTFDVNPEGITIEEAGVIIMQRNLAGDLKKSTLKPSAPTIKVNSSYLALGQRNQFASLVGVADTFLSFQTRDDWQAVDELATVLTTTTLKIQNSSATRLSTQLVLGGFTSIITPVSVSVFAGQGYGTGGFGSGGYSGFTFDPGAMTYDDTSRVITMANALPSTNLTVLVTYTYKGWLVNMERFQHVGKGGWLDRFTYDFQLTGA